MRDLYFELLGAGEGVRALLRGNYRTLADHLETLDCLRQLETSQPRTVPDEMLWDLYELHRVTDILLQAFQGGLVGSQRSEWIEHFRATTDGGVAAGPAPVIDLDDFSGFYESAGCCVKDGPRTFHPFFHEVVEVSHDETLGDSVVVERVLWPCVFFGELLVSRAGVSLRVGPDAVVRTYAATNPLYFTFWRLHRETRDPSHGWGHNSQWRTDGRRDYRVANRLIFNADGRYRLGDANTLERDELGRELMAETDLPSRVNVLRYRCVPGEPDDGERWPWHDRFDEVVSSR